MAANPTTISCQYEPGYNIDGYLFRVSDGKVYEGGTGGDSDWSTWADADVIKYAMAYTDKGGGEYTLTFPTTNVGDGVEYDVIQRERIGASAATTDPVLGSDKFNAADISGLAADVYPAGYLGNYLRDAVVYFLWRTPIAPSANGTIKVYKNDGTSEVTIPTGITDTRDFDSKTGVHQCVIDTDHVLNSFYAKECDYSVVLSGATVAGKTVNAVLATFAIEQRDEGRQFFKNG